MSAVRIAAVSHLTNMTKCPQCGGQDWITVDVCPQCLQKTTGPVTLRIHSCEKEEIVGEAIGDFLVRLAKSSVKASADDVERAQIIAAALERCGVYSIADLKKKVLDAPAEAAAAQRGPVGPGAMRDSE